MAILPGLTDADLARALNDSARAVLLKLVFAPALLVGLVKAITKAALLRFIAPAALDTLGPFIANVMIVPTRLTFNVVDWLIVGAFKASNVVTLPGLTGEPIPVKTTAFITAPILTFGRVTPDELFCDTVGLFKASAKAMLFRFRLAALAEEARYSVIAILDRLTLYATNMDVAGRFKASAMFTLPVLLLPLPVVIGLLKDSDLIMLAMIYDPDMEMIGPLMFNAKVLLLTALLPLPDKVTLLRARELVIPPTFTLPALFSDGLFNSTNSSMLPREPLPDPDIDIDGATKANAFVMFERTKLPEAACVIDSEFKANVPVAPFKVVTPPVPLKTGLFNNINSVTLLKYTFS